MSSQPASAAAILATVQDARLRLRTLAHRHLPVDASLRLAVAGASTAGATSDPLLHRPPPTVSLLRVQILRELRQSGALSALEAVAPPRSTARAPAVEEAATRVAAAAPAKHEVLATERLDDAASQHPAPTSTVDDDEVTLHAGLPPLLEDELEDPETDESESSPPPLASAPEEEAVSESEVEATRLVEQSPALLAAIQAADATEDEPTRLERATPELLAALAAEDADPSEDVVETTFTFGEEDELFDDEESEEEATRISRIPPEVLRTIAEQRAREESTSAPVLTVQDPGDGETGLSFSETGSSELTFSSDELFGDEEEAESSGGVAFSDDDALFGDEGDAFTEASPFTEAEEDGGAFPEWAGSGASEADFDVVFNDGEGSAKPEEPLEASADEDQLPEMEEWSPEHAASYLSQDEPDEEDGDERVDWPEQDGGLDEADTAAPAVMLGAPRAVSPGIRVAGAGEPRPGGGAAIQILGYGKARTLTPTLALGAAPEDEAEAEDEELILDGEQPQLAVAFQEPDEEPTGRHVPTLTEEPSGGHAISVLDRDPSASASGAGSSLSTEDVEGYLERARAAEQGGRLRDAVVHYDDLLGHAPHNLAAHLGRGRCLVDLGDYSAAMSDFTRAEDIAPESAEPIVEMGSLFFARKEWKKAISYFDHALEISANHTMALCRRGICHYHRKRYDSAAADLQAAKANGANVPGLERYIRMATKRAKKGRH